VCSCRMGVGWVVTGGSSKIVIMRIEEIMGVVVQV
jgi:hypothetical protein